MLAFSSVILSVCRFYDVTKRHVDWLRSSFRAGNHWGIAGPSSKAKSGPSALMLIAFGFFSGLKHTAVKPSI